MFRSNVFNGRGIGPEIQIRNLPGLPLCIVAPPWFQAAPLCKIPTMTDMPTRRAKSTVAGCVEAGTLPCCCRGDGIQCDVE